MTDTAKASFYAPQPDKSGALAKDNAALLKSIADFCLDSLPGISERKVAELEAILQFIAEHMKFRERLDLSISISRMERVPGNLVTFLLNDVYAVAQPIIENLDCVDNEALLCLARKNEENYLFSIAKRRIVPIILTDIIVEKGQNPSVFTVARNQGAQFSLQGFDRLTLRAQTEVTLQNILANRIDLPPEICKRLVAITAARAQRVPSPGSVLPGSAPSTPRADWTARDRHSTSALAELREKLRETYREK